MRAVTEREPEWGDDDRGWAFALLEDDADRCQGCGQPLSESTRPDAEGAYRADLPTRCHACTPFLRQQEEYKDSTPGLLFTVSRKRAPAPAT